MGFLFGGIMKGSVLILRISDSDKEIIRVASSKVNLTMSKFVVACSLKVANETKGSELSEIVGSCRD